MLVSNGFLVGYKFSDTPPTSLVDSIVNLNVKTMEGWKVRARPLARNTSGVEGRAGALG
jgi:hypothetical protein